MSDYGLTDKGFIRPTLEEIRESIRQSFRDDFGKGINLDDRSPFGNIVNTMADRFDSLWQVTELLWQSMAPDMATGQALDQLCAINNITRLAAASSQVTLALTGTAGTVLAAGLTVSAPGNTSVKFALDEAVTLTGGTDTVTSTCTKTGQISAAAGTLTHIDNPIAGWSTVTNPADAVLGRAVETDSELRLRRLQLLNRKGTATIDGIRAYLLANVANIIQAHVYENYTSTVDSEGLPPKSIECVVAGGTDQNVADAIWACKPGGIQPYGTSSATAIDSEGNSHTIGFSRPSPISIYVKATLVRNTNPSEGDVYPADGDDAVKAAILAFGQDMAVGHDVILSQFYTPINTVAGVFGIDLRIGTAPNPTGTANITIHPREIASFEEANIEVL